MKVLEKLVGTVIRAEAESKRREGERDELEGDASEHGVVKRGKSDIRIFLDR